MLVSLALSGCVNVLLLQCLCLLVSGCKDVYLCVFLVFCLVVFSLGVMLSRFINV